MTSIDCALPYTNSSVTKSCSCYFVCIVFDVYARIWLRVEFHRQFPIDLLKKFVLCLVTRRIMSANHFVHNSYATGHFMLCKYVLTITYSINIPCSCSLVTVSTHLKAPYTKQHLGKHVSCNMFTQMLLSVLGLLLYISFRGLLKLTAMLNVSP